MSSRLRNLGSTRISFFAFQDIITSVSGILILVTLILAADLDKITDGTSSESNPEFERQLAELIQSQNQLELENQRMQKNLAEAESLPNAEKLQQDIASLKTQLEFEQKQVSALDTEGQKREIASRQQEVTLGLSNLRQTIESIKKETEQLAQKNLTVAKQAEQLRHQLEVVQTKLLKVKSREGQVWLIPEASNSTKEPILVVASGQGIIVERFDRPDLRKTFPISEAGTKFKSYISSLSKIQQYFVFYVRPSGIELFNELSEVARDQSFDVGFDAVDENQVVHFSKPESLDVTTETLSTVRPPVAPSSTIATSNTPPKISSSDPSPKQNAPKDALPKTSASPPPSAKNLKWWQKILRAVGLY